MAEMPVMPVKVQPATPKGSAQNSAGKSEAAESNKESSSFSKALDKHMDGGDKPRETRAHADRTQTAAREGEKADPGEGKTLPQETAATDKNTSDTRGDEVLNDTLLADGDTAVTPDKSEETEVSPLALTQMLMEAQPTKPGKESAATNPMTTAAEQARQIQARALAAARSDANQSTTPVAQAVQDALNDGDLPSDILKQMLGKSAEKADVANASAQVAQLARTAGQPNPDRMAMSDTLVNHTGQALSQASQVNPATTSTSLPTTQIPLPMQHPQWGDAMSEKVMWVANQKLQGAEIKLNPPQLGPIEVRVKLNNDNGQSQAHVSFTAHHALTRDALENALPRLRDMFNANGVDLLDVNVSDRSFAEQDRDTAQAQQERFNAGIQSGFGEDEGLQELSTKVTHLPSGAVDLFA